MADGSRHSLRMVAESTYGTTPTTPVFDIIRHTGTTLGLSKEGVQSEEIRDDRQITDFRHGARQVGGDINIELSYGSFDVILEALLGGTWTPKATITATTLSALASDNSYNDSGSGFVAAGFEVGDDVVVTGFTGDIDNNITSGIITAVTAGKITIGGTDGDVIVDDAAGESVTIATREQILKAGTTRRSFTLERFFGDIQVADKPFHRFTGVEFNSMSLAINANAMVTGTVGVVGQDMATDTVIVSGATYNAASTTSPLDSFTGSLKEGGSLIAVITEISLELNNGLDPRFVVGSKASIRPAIGRSNVSGQVTAFFENSTLLDKFNNETETSIEFSLPDGAGNVQTYLMSRVKYTGGQPDVEGEGPVTLAMPFQALLHSATGTNIQISRTPA